VKQRLQKWLRRAAAAISPLPPGARLSFAQEGEDLALGRLLDDVPIGFYVDVGAHHPVHLSNTCHFYLRGWRGINIDPGADFAAAFARARSRDINLNIGIAKEAALRTYYEFNEPALNTFDADLARRRSGVGPYRLIGERTVSVVPLRQVLEQHLPPGQAITFLSSDVEGLDLEVLQSNDWRRFRPRAVVAEVHNAVEVGDLEAHPLTRFMAEVGYRPISNLALSVIFADDELQKRFRT
jgi:FkbM family methyltransferase